MLEDEELLQSHYEDWALMRDPDKSAMFTNMVAGLNSILFAINIDNKTLNSTNVETKSFLTNMKNEPVIITRVPSVDTQSASSGSSYEGRQGRRRKVVKQIITFDDDDDLYNISDKKIDSTNSEVTLTRGKTTFFFPPSSLAGFHCKCASGLS